MSNLREQLNGEPLWGLPQNISDEIVNIHDAKGSNNLSAWLYIVTMCLGFAIGVFWLWPLLTRLNDENAIGKANELGAMLFHTNFGIGLFIGMFVWIVLSSSIIAWLTKATPMPLKSKIFWGNLSQANSNRIEHKWTKSVYQKSIQKLMESNDRPENAGDLINKLSKSLSRKVLLFSFPMILVTAFITYKEIQNFSIYSETGYYKTGFFSEETRSWDEAVSVQLGCNHVTGRNASDDIIYKVLFNDKVSKNIADAKPITGTWSQHALKINSVLESKNISFERWSWRNRNPLHLSCLDAQAIKYSQDEVLNILSLLRAGEFAHDDLNASLQHKLAAISKNKKDYRRSEALLLQVLAQKEAEFGEEHPETAYTLDRLGSIFYQEKQYEKAREFHERALGIRTLALGKNHTKTATSLNNLALVYQGIGEYKKAEPLYIQALKIREESDSPDNISTAIALNNLASLYQIQGHFSKAEALYLRSLKIRTALYGEDHLSTAKAMNSLGSLYSIQGNMIKAEDLLLKALDIKKEAKGDNRRTIAASHSSLGWLYDVQGNYEKAEAEHFKALTIRKSILGDSHPATANALKNLGRAYVFQGEYSKAEPVLLEALAIQEAAYKSDHVSVASTLNILGVLYTRQYEYMKAEPLLLRALDIRKAQLTPNHPYLINTLKNLAKHYSMQNRTSDAEHILKQIRAVEKPED